MEVSMLNRKFIYFLLLLFGTAFFWAGGSNVTDLVKPKTMPSIPAISMEEKAPAGTWERIYRIIDLKSAVNTKIDKRSYVPLSEIPLTMQQAIIAIEDNRFYHHTGFDIEGILRASLVNLQTGQVTEGGSTITQQLVKNMFLSQDRTLIRKSEEFVLALDMEARYSKEEILEMYLNTIYFGSSAYGIKEASRIYFNKTPAKLTLPESAMLAGLPNAPSLYSPLVDFKAAKQRQAVVLSVMAKQGYIGNGQALEAKEAPLNLAK
jgi:penicillin-binding protein 1A